MKADHVTTTVYPHKFSSYWTYEMLHEGTENDIWVEAAPEGVTLTVHTDAEKRKTVKRLTWDDIIGLSMQDADLDTWANTEEAKCLKE